MSGANRIPYTREMFANSLRRMKDDPEFHSRVVSDFCDLMWAFSRGELDNELMARYDAGHEKYGELFLDGGRSWKKERRFEFLDFVTYHDFDEELEAAVGFRETVAAGEVDYARRRHNR